MLRPAAIEDTHEISSTWKNRITSYGSKKLLNSWKGVDFILSNTIHNNFVVATESDTAVLLDYRHYRSCPYRVLNMSDNTIVLKAIEFNGDFLT